MGTILKFQCYGAVRLCQPDREKIFWLKQRHTLIKTLSSNKLQHLSRHQRCLIHWPRCHPFEPPRKSGSMRWNSPGRSHIAQATAAQRQSSRPEGPSPTDPATAQKTAPRATRWHPPPPEALAGWTRLATASRHRRNSLLADGKPPVNSSEKTTEGKSRQAAWEASRGSSSPAEGERVLGLPAGKPLVLQELQQHPTFCSTLFVLHFPKPFVF